MSSAFPEKIENLNEINNHYKKINDFFNNTKGFISRNKPSVLKMNKIEIEYFPMNPTNDIWKAKIVALKTTKIPRNPALRDLLGEVKKGEILNFEKKLVNNNQGYLFIIKREISEKNDYYYPFADLREWYDFLKNNFGIVKEVPDAAKIEIELTTPGTIDSIKYDATFLAINPFKKLICYDKGNGPEIRQYNYFDGSFDYFRFEISIYNNIQLKNEY